MSEPQLDDDVMRDLKRDLQALGAVYPDDVEPPARFDDAIRAAARRAVRAKPGAEAFWWPRTSPFAAAAVLVLTVSIAFLAMDDPKVQELGAEAPPGVVVQIAPPADPPAAQMVPDALPKVAKQDEPPKLTRTEPVIRKDSRPEPRADANVAARGEKSAQPAQQRDTRTQEQASPPPSRVQATVGFAAEPPALRAPSVPPAPSASSVTVPAPIVQAAASPPPPPSAAAPVSAPAPLAAASVPPPVAAARAPAPSESLRAAADDSRLKGLEKRERYEVPAPATLAVPARPTTPAGLPNPPLARDPAPQSTDTKLAEKMTDRAAVPVTAASPLASPAAAPAALASPAQRRLADVPPVALKSAPPMLQEDAPLMPQLWAARIRNMQLTGQAKEAEQELARFKQRYPAYPIEEVLKTPALFLTKADVEASPAAWILHIRSLRALDRQKDAEAELARFRPRYPNYLLPEELRPQDSTRQK